MGIELSEADFDRLARILSENGDWQTVRGRVDFMSDVFAGSPRKTDILTSLDLDGKPRGTAVRVIHRLATFGQDQPGRETLGVLINKLRAYLGGGEPANFLRDLLTRYPFETPPVATQPIASWGGRETEQSVAEKIIGENTLRDIYVLEQLLELAPSVVRIKSTYALGTGFLIARDLIMTNNHVIPDESVATKATFTFNFQLDSSGVARPAHPVRALPGGLFHTSPMAPANALPGQLDFTVVQVQDVPDRYRPLALKPTAPPKESRVVIIQHPGGDYKKISFQNNFVAFVDEFVVQYTTSTEPGSSGSPVFNDDMEVVAIHHAGGKLNEPTTTSRYLRNEGIRMSVILAELQEKAPAIYRRLGA